jgi:hypothetical protein
MSLRWSIASAPIVLSLSFVATLPSIALTADKDLGRPTIMLKSQKIDLPRGNLKFPGETSGARAASTYCVMCHSRGMIDAQPPLSREQWKTEVHKMRSNYGCPLSESLDDELVDFLFQYNNRTASASSSK